MALEYGVGVTLHIWYEVSNCFGNSKMKVEDAKQILTVIS